MVARDFITWLQENTILNRLTPQVLAEIAPQMKLISVSAQETLITAGKAPEGLYILKSGQIAGQDQTSPGKVFNLRALILDQPGMQTITTVSDCQFWVIPAAEFQPLLKQYPEITQAFSQYLAEEIEHNR